MTYEEALVEGRCCQASPEDQMQQALNHYEGIAKVVMHWNFYITNAIKAYPRITALETALADAVRERDEARGYVQRISNMTGFRCTNEDCPAVQAHIYINGLRKVTR